MSPEAKNYQTNLCPAPLVGKQTGYFLAECDQGHFFLRLKPSCAPFRFKVFGLKKIALWTLVRRAFKRDRHNFMLALGAFLIGASKEVRQAFRFACAGEPLSGVGHWWAEREIAIGSAHSQYYTAEKDQEQKVHKLALPGHACYLPAFRNNSDDLNRFVFAHNDQIIGAGPELLSLVIQQYIEDPSIELWIADENLKQLSDGTKKAEQAPICLSVFNYRLYPERFNSVIFSPKGIERAEQAGFVKDKLSFEDLRDYIFDVLSHRPERVRTLTTPLLVHHKVKADQINHSIQSRSLVDETQKSETSSIRLSIIIPTKNNFKLLKACLDSIMRFTPTNQCEVIIVDNGSRLDILSQYQELLDNKAHIHFIKLPGAFNFAKLCNEGAKQATHDRLVFLNDDTELRDEGALLKLAQWLDDKKVGAVGPCLLFPNGYIQHAGIVIGMGGIADHIFHGLSPDDPLYYPIFDRPREVSAVTGACLAIRKDLFHNLNGFDAVNLPVECNDVDLCLRIKEAGLSVLLDPRIRIIHHQSASRGFSYRPFQRYAKERTYFTSRWHDIILDDPLFHPAYSLYSTTPCLDD